MKSNKIFFLLIFILFILLWCLNFVVHNDPYHASTFIELFTTAIGGSLILFYTLKRAFFLNFISLYSLAWVFYFLLKLFSLLFPVINLYGKNIHTVNFVFFYYSYTQLFTPLPFILYWIFVKIVINNSTKIK